MLELKSQALLKVEQYLKLLGFPSSCFKTKQALNSNLSLYIKIFKSCLNFHCLQKRLVNALKKLQVKQIIKCYTGYTDPNEGKDITLLKLRTKLKFDEYIDKINLPPQGVDVPVGSTCVITGFGALSEGYLFNDFFFSN